MKQGLDERPSETFFRILLSLHRLVELKFDQLFSKLHFKILKKLDQIDEWYYKMTDKLSRAVVGN